MVERIYGLTRVSHGQAEAGLLRSDIHPVPSTAIEQLFQTRTLGWRDRRELLAIFLDERAHKSPKMEDEPAASIRP